VDNKEGEAAGNVVMADDGTGESVSIPTFLVGMYDGAKLKQ
jgi:hypothetical protein